MNLSWPRFRRLVRRAQFTACYDRGSRHYTRHFVVFALPSPCATASNTSYGTSYGTPCAGTIKDAANGPSLPLHPDLSHPQKNSPTQNANPPGEGSAPSGPHASGARLGLAVTKKCGNAVQRNRIKRVLREFFRLHQHSMPNIDIVVTPKRHLSASKVHLAFVERELTPLLTALAKERLSPAQNAPAAKTAPLRPSCGASA